VHEYVEYTATERQGSSTLNRGKVHL
jgi:hypothetical protein